MTYFLNVGSHTWFISSTHEGVDYVYGLRELHPDNLIAIELGYRVYEEWKA